MSDRLAFAAFVFMLWVGILGFGVGANIDGDSDPDCAWASDLRQREDQKAAYDGKPGPNCHKVCEIGPLWFWFGEEKDCHWDDDGTFTAEGGGS